MPGMPPRRSRWPLRCRAGAYFAKWIIAVDEDIDPSNMDEVLWAMGSRCNPADDIDIHARHLEHASSTPASTRRRTGPTAPRR